MVDAGIDARADARNAEAGSTDGATADARDSSPSLADSAADVSPAVADAAPRPSDWASVFLRLADTITMQTKITCDWAIPSNNGAPIDPAKVNVRFTSGAGTVAKIGKVPPGEICGTVGGWIFDDEGMPGRVRLCPSTCETVQSDPRALVEILFGCKTVVGGGIVN